MATVTRKIKINEKALLASWVFPSPSIIPIKAAEPADSITARPQTRFV